MQAVYQIECKNFELALDNLLRSKIIYTKISQFKDTLEEIIYKEKVSQLDTLIRQCAFSLKMGAADGDKVISQMVDKFPKKADLEDQVARVKSQTKREQIENIEEINYNNKIIPLKTEKLRTVFKRVQLQMQDIQDYQGAAGFEAGQQIKSYLQLVNILEDAALVIKKEKAEESKKSEQSGQLYNILLSYVQKLKLQSALERNLLQAKTLGKKILQAGEAILFGGAQYHKLKSDLRPQNVVRFYEKALKAQRSILNLEKDALDPFKALEYEFSERLCTTQIRFFIGLHYANERAYTEALMVLQRVAQDVESTIDFALKSNLGDKRNVKREIQETLEEGTLKRL